MHCTGSTIRFVYACRLLTAALLLLLITGSAGPGILLAADALHGRKVLWVSSYHEGYEANDDIQRGIHAVLDSTGVTLKTVHLDTKRNNREEDMLAAGRRAVDELTRFAPDVVIVSDDNAQQDLVLTRTRIPTGSTADWMSAYVAVVAAQVPEEQGTLAARMALDILGGQPPGQIPVARNTLVEYTVNLAVARSAGIVFPVSLLKRARTVGRAPSEPVRFQQAAR